MARSCCLFLNVRSSTTPIFGFNFLLAFFCFFPFPRREESWAIVCRICCSPPPAREITSWSDVSVVATTRDSWCGLRGVIVIVIIVVICVV